MIIKIKSLAQLLSVALFLSILGCSSELDNIEKKDVETGKLIVLHKNFDFVKSNSVILNKISNSKINKSSNLQSKIIQTNDFKIFTDRVTYTTLTDKSRESYSFYIEKNNPVKSDFIENLIFVKEAKKENYRAYIATYFFPDGINSNHNNFKVIAFKEINSQTLSTKNLFAKTTCQDSYTYEIIETKHDCYSGEHTGAGQAGSCNGRGALPYSTYSIAFFLTICGDGSGGGSGDGGGGDGGYTYEGPSDPGLGNYNTPTGPNTLPVDTGMTFPSPCQTDDCSEVLVVNEINDLLDKSLNYDQLEWLAMNTSAANEIKSFLVQNNTTEAKAFAKQIFTQMTLNSDLKLDINASFKSPFNIDRSTITDTTPEGAKFNEVYKALTDSPEFKKLFLDMFDNNQGRFNVKFEIADAVFDPQNPTKEVNGITSYNGTPNLVIKINKKILMAGTDMSKTKIEVAKTILHECIHAYLFIKANNPTVGMDIAGIINKMYPTANEQHDFMYGKMIPTMQKVFSEIRDSVTTTAGRAVLETQYTMHPTTNPLTSTPWNWSEYFKYLSFSGLQEASCFKIDFPEFSDQLNLLAKYIEYGHKELQP